MRVKDMEFFHEASKRICGSLEAETMLADIRAYLEQFMPAEDLNLNIYDPEKKTIFSIAGVNVYQEDWFHLPVKLSAEGIRFIEGDHPDRVHIVNRPETDPVAKNVFPGSRRPGFSFLVLQLEVSGEILGVLVASARGRNRYQPEHARLLGLLHDPFAIAMANTLKHQEVLRLKEMLADDYRYLAGEMRHLSGDEIIGEEYGLKPVMDLVRQVAPLDSHALLLGETGVGKEVIANAIHYSSPRHNGPFIKVNCGALPETLVDSELFGHEKGAFTGAAGTKRGRFERAHGGTIFLDEIGDLPLTAQTRLLRVIQEKRIERVGGTNAIDLDIRIIAATHRDLQQMVRRHAFREDLWFRLNVFPITIPPLRQRKADIPALVQYFVRKKCHEMKTRRRPRIASGEMEKLVNHDWPGNVRELENMVERSLIRSLAGSTDHNLRFDALPLPTPRPAVTDPLPPPDVLSLDDMIRNHIRKTLAVCKGKVEGRDGAAAYLDVNPSTLRNRMRRLGIAFGKGNSA